MAVHEPNKVRSKFIIPDFLPSIKTTWRQRKPMSILKLYRIEIVDF